MARVVFAVIAVAAWRLWIAMVGCGSIAAVALGSRRDGRNRCCEGDGKCRDDYRAHDVLLIEKTCVDLTKR